MNVGSKQSCKELKLNKEGILVGNKRQPRVRKGREGSDRVWTEYAPKVKVLWGRRVNRQSHREAKQRREEEEALDVVNKKSLLVFPGALLDEMWQANRLDFSDHTVNGSCVTYLLHLYGNKGWRRMEQCSAQKETIIKRQWSPRTHPDVSLFTPPLAKADCIHWKPTRQGFSRKKLLW